jgi:hypothetical protein
MIGDVEETQFVSTDRWPVPMRLIGNLLAALTGIGFLIIGFLDRKDGLLIAGAILIGSVLIAERPREKPSAGDRAP